MWRHNHVAGAGSGVMAALGGARFLSGVSAEMKRRSNGLRFVPSMDRNTQMHLAKRNTLDLDAFSRWLMEASTPCPLLIDKVFALDDVQSALNYAVNSDDAVLGENIGLLIRKETDDGFFGEGCKSPVLRLPQLGDRNRSAVVRLDSDAVDEKYVRPRTSEFAESESVHVVESQTIAKKTSSKS